MFKKILLITALILSACSSVKDQPLPVTTSSDKALEFFNSAVRHWEHGEPDEARANFQSALRVDPNFVMANLWGWSEDPVQTRKYREVAVSNKDKVSEAEKLLVEMWEAGRDGNTTKQMEFAKELVNKYPNSSDSYVELGNMYKNETKLDGAIENYNKALKLNPDNYQAYAQLAQLHVVTGNNIMLPKERQSRQKAVEYAEEMIRIRPLSPFAHQIRANIERQNSNFEEGNKLYQKMIDVCNETGSTAKGRALLVSAHNLMFSGKFDQSMNRYDEAVAISETPNQAFQRRLYQVVAHLFENKYYEALDQLDEMAKTVNETSTSQERVNLNTATLYWHKLMIQSHNQQKAEAFKSLAQWKKYRKLDLDNDNQRDVDGYNANNYAMEAWLNTLFGNYDKSKSLLAKHYAIANNWESAGALDNYNAQMGMVYMMQGNPIKALEYFNERIIPANYQYFSYFKALALKATQKNKEASEIFEFISNYNFLSWEVGLTRNLAKKELDS